MQTTPEVNYNKMNRLNKLTTRNLQILPTAATPFPPKAKSRKTYKKKEANKLYRELLF